MKNQNPKKERNLSERINDFMCTEVKPSIVIPVSLATLLAGIVLVFKLPNQESYKDTTPTNYVMTGNFKGYATRAFTMSGNRITISDKQDYSPINDPYILGIDSNQDGRFDEIILGNVPKNNPLEKLATLDNLSEAYKETKLHGKIRR